MKHNFVRMKTRAKSVSLRTLALVMGVVMLLSAIGVGSTLSAYAVSADESTQSGALSAAAVVGSDIADRVALFNDSLVAEANAALRGDKADLADTGAEADVADTGATTYRYLWYDMTNNNGQLSALTTKVTLSATDDNYYTGSFTSNGNNIHFIINSSSSAHTSSSLNSSTTVTYKGDVADWTRRYENSGSYGVEGQLDNGKTYYIGYNVSTNTVIVGSSAADIENGGGSGSGGTGTTKKIYVAVVQYIYEQDFSSNTTTLGNALRLHYWGGTDGTKDATSFTYMGTVNHTDTDGWKASNTYYKYYTTIPSDATSMKAWLDLDDDRWFGANGNASTNNTIYIYNYSGDKADYTSEAVTYSGLSAKLKIDGVETTKNGFSATLGATDNVSGTTGTTATAVNGDSTNYKFDGWTSSGGTFTTASNLSTTFKPTADNAVAYASFSEKSYSVSVSSANTSYGTVSTSTISAKPLTATALSSITVTPKSGYKFSGWTTTGSVTLSSQSSSDPTAGTIKATAAGGTLKANFAAKNYTVSYGSATNGTFTVKKTADSSAVATEASLPYNTGITVECTPDKGYKLSSVKVNNSTSGVSGSGNTRTFNVPAANATITVTFALDDLAISTGTSPAGKGTVVASKTSGGSSTSTYQLGNTLYLKVTSPDGAYTVGGYTVTYNDGYVQTIEGATGNTGAIDVTHYGNTGAISIVANMVKKPTHSVTVVSNNKLLGKATSSVTNAYNGQSVTINAIEETGTFSAWSKNADAAGTITNTSNASTTFTMGDTDVILTATFTAYAGGNSDYYYNAYTDGGAIAGTNYGKVMQKAKISGNVYYYAQIHREDNHLFTISKHSPCHAYDDSAWIYFEVPNNSVDFGESNDMYIWFESADGVTVQPYTKMNKVDDRNGHKMWRYHVPYRARYCYIQDNSTKKHTKGIDLANNPNASENIYYINGGDDGYGFSVGKGVLGYGFYNPVHNGYDEYYNSSLYSNMFGTKGFSNDNQASHNYTKLNDPVQDYYVLYLIGGKQYTINGVTATPSSDTVIWTTSLPTPPVEPDGTTRVTLYAKNGTLRDSTFNRFTNLADTQFEDYFSYSERTDSGVITYNSYAAYNAAHPDAPQITIEPNVSFGNSSYDIMRNVPVGAKVKVTTELSPNGEIFRGEDKFSDTHYLKAYSFNGMTYKVFTKNDGVATTNGKKFTEEWTVRAVNTVRTNDDKSTTALTRNLGTEAAPVRIVEITPIYYMQDNTNCKTFYIDGYDGTVQQAWGNMLAVYPYYEGKSNSENAFGGYPGQPMLFWGGKYQMEIPLTVDGTAGGATVKGLTLHNGYWDLLHRSVDLICNEHAQTYDFDDFYKIYKEKNPDSIIFDFKYRTTEDNYNDGNRDDYGYYKFAETTTKGASDFDGEGHNGVELLTDYYGRPVDVFGKVLSDSQRSTWSDTGTINHTQTKELLLVSNGYKHTYTGWYATMYAVYAPASDIPTGSGDTAKKFIGYITPSMLYLNNIGRVAQYGADTTGGLDMTSTDPNMQDTYNHLKTYYSGVPAVIAYEKEILNDSRDQAKRSDGKWYYSNNTDQITANITIQYIDTEADVESVLNSANHGLTSDKWVNEATYSAGLNSQPNVGDHSKCTAYFTNTSPYLLGKVNSGLQFADSTKFFTFKAQAAGKYMFVGWVRERNGQYYSISDEEIGTSSMSANDHYIARFVKTTSGALTVSHNVEQTSQYTGKGTPYLTVTVLNGSNEEVFSQTVNDGSKIDVTDYITTKYNDFKINISLSTAPDVASESIMQEYVAPVVSGIGSIASTTPASVAGSTATTTATVAEFTVSQLLALTGDNEISSLNYISHLSVPSYSYKYEIKYNYTSRFWDDQSYTATGEILSTDIEGMQNVTGSKLSAGLTDEFIENKTPFEKNLNQTITWKYGEKTKETTKDSTWTQENQVFLIKYNVGTDQVVNDRVTAEFKLPYPYDPATYKPFKVDAYNGTGNDATPTGNSDYVYDDRHDTVKLSTKAYHLFTTDGTVVQGGDNVHATGLPLLQAAPYIIKGAEARIANKLTLQYFTGTSYTVDGQTGLYFVAKNESGVDTCYWYNVAPGAAYTGSANRVQLKETDVVDADTIPGIPAHTYAVKGKFNNQDVVYFFDPATAEKGQYNMHYFTDQIEGYKDNTGTKYYFTRWDIRNSKGDYIASSYLSTFNYSGYEDYSVEAIYDSLTPNPETDDAVAKVPTISYIGDSRNQWNNDGGTDGSGQFSSKVGRPLEDGDVLFHDFAISYDYYGEEIAKIDSSDKVIRIGMLIEQVGELESVDGSKITDASYYADKFKDDYNAAALKNALEKNTNPKSVTNHNTVNSKIGNNVNNNWGQKFGTEGAYNPFGFSDVIDNMNRLQWYYTFDNNKDGENFRNANYVYRASAYIIEDTGNNARATLSSTPVYFTLYDSARR